MTLILFAIKYREFCGNVPLFLRYNTAREESVFSQNLKEKWEQLIRELPFHKNSQMFKK